MTTGRRATPIAVMAAIVVLLTAGLTATARGEHRHALVIGQSTYKTGTLAAPPRDVAAVAEALAKQGFVITKAENTPTAAKLGEAVNEFAKAVPTNGTAVVYFSGHAGTVPVFTGTNPPRSDTGLMAVDGIPLPLASMFGAIVKPGLNVSGTGLFSGARVSAVIVDAAPPQPKAPAAAAQPTAAQPASPPAAPPHIDPPLGGVAILRPADAPVPAADAPGLSPLAAKLVAGLAAGQPLGAVLTGLSPRMFSAVDADDMARLAAPASRAVSPPTTLAPGTKPGDEWVDKNGIVFCWCPPGEFTIGSPPTEPQRQKDEFQAVVSFAEGFWMAKHELCYRESLALGLMGGGSGEHKLQPLNMLGAGLGVKQLEAANAAAPPGWQYDVPTEAEWEYAARAGAKTAYWFGDDPALLGRHGNFADKSLRTSNVLSEVAKHAGQRTPHRVFNGDLQTGLFSYAHPSWTDGTATVARVGSYPPNPWGLCDMHGNVAEWTTTLYDAYRTGPVVPPAQRAAWAALPENKKYFRGSVCKGGSWASAADSCRSAFRGWATGPYEYINGVRLVLRRAGAAARPLATRWTPLVPTSVVASSGAASTISPDGTVLVTGTAVAGDTYTISCPVPSGVSPRELKLEMLTDPSLPSQGPGRGGYGSISITEVTITGVRGGVPSSAFEVLDVRSDQKNDTRSDRQSNPLAASANLVDGKPETTWGGYGQGKLREVVFTIGLPTHTGVDAARWRYPLESVAKGPLSAVTVSIAHAKDTPAATLGKFRLALLNEEPTSP